jgi:predicted Holliday junction resolvase-like endonuclease
VVGIVIAIILFFVSIGIVVFLILLIKRRKFKMKQKRKKRNRRMRSSLYRTQERLKTQETQVSEKRDYNTSEKGTTSSVTNTQVTTGTNPISSNCIELKIHFFLLL